MCATQSAAASSIEGETIPGAAAVMADVRAMKAVAGWCMFNAASLVVPVHLPHTNPRRRFVGRCDSGRPPYARRAFQGAHGCPASTLDSRCARLGGGCWRAKCGPSGITEAPLPLSERRAAAGNELQRRLRKQDLKPVRLAVVVLWKCARHPCLCRLPCLRSTFTGSFHRPSFLRERPCATRAVCCFDGRVLWL